MYFDTYTICWTIIKQYEDNNQKYVRLSSLNESPEVFFECEIIKR